MLAVNKRQTINTNIPGAVNRQSGRGHSFALARVALRLTSTLSSEARQAPGRVLNPLTLCLLLVGIGVETGGFEREGLKINDQCSASNRTPEQPYNSRDPKAENGCFLCHSAGESGLSGHGRMAYESANLDFFCTLSLTNKAPEIAFIGARKTNIEQPLEFLLRAEDGDGDNLTFHGVNLPRGAVIRDHRDGTAIFSWVPSREQAGRYRVSFLVSDSGFPTAVDSEQVLISVSDGNDPPLLAPVGNKTVQEGKEISFVLSANDSDGDDVFFKHNGLPQGARLLDNGDGTALFTWTPSAGSEGAYPITFIAGDGIDFDQETVVILVTYASASNNSASQVLGSLQ